MSAPINTMQSQPTREELDRARSVVHAVSGAFSAKVVGQVGLQQSLLIQPRRRAHLGFGSHGHSLNVCNLR